MYQEPKAGTGVAPSPSPFHVPTAPATERRAHLCGIIEEALAILDDEDLFDAHPSVQAYGGHLQ